MPRWQVTMGPRVGKGGTVKLKNPALGGVEEEATVDRCRCDESNPRASNSRSLVGWGLVEIRYSKKTNVQEQKRRTSDIPRDGEGGFLGGERASKVRGSAQRDKWPPIGEATSTNKAGDQRLTGLIDIHYLIFDITT